MADKKPISRIISEMNRTMHGLHRHGVLTAKELKTFLKGVEEKTKQRKTFDVNKTSKSQTSE